MYEFILLILGLSEDDLPDPAMDVSEFESAFGRYLDVLPQTYNPITGRLTPWLDKRKVMKAFGRGGGCVIS